jgi:hypothetical protein
VEVLDVLVNDIDIDAANGQIGASPQHQLKRDAHHSRDLRDALHLHTYKPLATYNR